MLIMLTLLFTGCQGTSGSRFISPEAEQVYKIVISDNACGEVTETIITDIHPETLDSFQFKGAEFTAITVNGRKITEPVDDFNYSVKNLGVFSFPVDIPDTTLDRYVVEITYAHKIPCSYYKKRVYMGYSLD